VADASLSQLPQKGSRRLLPASAPPAVGTTSGRRRCRVEAARHPRRKAAQCTKCAAELHTFGPLCRLTFVFAPPNSSSAARPAAARAASACCDVVGSPIPPTPVCFTHTEPTPKQKAGSSWIANAIDACCVSARSALRVSAPVAMAAANGARPAAPVRLFRCRLDRGRRRASISRSGSLCSPMRRACWHGCANAIRPAASAHFCAGSIERTTRSMSRIGRRASPRCTSAAMAAANSVSRAPSARFYARCPSPAAASSPGVRRCACRPAIACGKRLPSRPSAFVRHSQSLFCWSIGGAAYVRLRIKSQRRTNASNPECIFSF
jgi:hypothetical protein